MKFGLDSLSTRVDAVIFFSDFIRMDKNYSEDLSLISKKYESTAVMIKDPLDLTLPDVDREIVIEDPASGQQLLINPKKAKRIYERYAFEQEKMVRGLFFKSNIDLLRLTTDKNFVFPLAMFLKERVDSKGAVVSM